MQIKQNEELLHTCWNGYHQKSLQTISAGEGAEKKEPFYTVDGNGNIVHYGDQYGDSLKKWK